MGNFLQVKTESDDGSIALRQPKLIDLILEDLHLQENVNMKAKLIPACSSKLLHRESEGETIEPDYNYHIVIGKLHFHEKSIRPNSLVSINQCAWFQDKVKKSHMHAIRAIGHYLKHTQDKGIILQPDRSNLPKLTSY